MNWKLLMGAAIPLRGDFDAAGLRGLAKRSRDGAQSRRLLALAMIYDGHRRSEAARFTGVGLQTVRHWVLCFNAERPEGLVNRRAPGPAYKLSEERRATLAAIVESGPDPSIHGVVRWRRCDLAAWLLPGVKSGAAPSEARRRPTRKPRPKSLRYCSCCPTPSRNGT